MADVLHPECSYCQHEIPAGPPVLRLDYGLYFADGKYGDTWQECQDIGDTYYAWWRRGYERSSGSKFAEWWPSMQASLDRAVAEGYKIHFNCNMQEDWAPGYLRRYVAAEYLQYIERVEIADEPDENKWLKENIDYTVGLIKRIFPGKPCGFVWTQAQMELPDSHFESQDWVGIEAYAGNQDRGVDLNRAYITKFIDDQCKRFRRKDVVVVLQAYNRNGSWDNESTLAALVRDSYQVAAQHQNVVAFNAFNWGRNNVADPNVPEGDKTKGAKHLPLVATELRKITDALRI